MTKAEQLRERVVEELKLFKADVESEEIFDRPADVERRAARIVNIFAEGITEEMVETVRSAASLARVHHPKSTKADALLVAVAPVRTRRWHLALAAANALSHIPEASK